MSINKKPIRSYKDIVHIMIDVETTGLSPQTGRIWQLGAVALIQHNEIATGNFAGTSIPIPSKYGFQRTINPSQLMSEPSTVEWQRKSNAANWTDALSINPEYGEAYLHNAVLPDFIAWVRGWKATEVKFWCQGTDFDFPFLEAAFKEAGLTPPWTYRQKYDLRTLRNLLAPSVKEPEGTVTQHNAFADALYQLERLDSILWYLGQTRGIKL